MLSCTCVDWSRFLWTCTAFPIASIAVTPLLVCFLLVLRFLAGERLLRPLCVCVALPQPSSSDAMATPAPAPAAAKPSGGAPKTNMVEDFLLGGAWTQPATQRRLTRRRRGRIIDPPHAQAPDDSCTQTQARIESASSHRPTAAAAVRSRIAARRARNDALTTPLLVCVVCVQELPLLCPRPSPLPLSA